VIIALLLKPLHRHSEAGISRLIDWLVGGDGRSESPPARGGHLHLPDASGLKGENTWSFKVLSVRKTAAGGTTADATASPSATATASPTPLATTGGSSLVWSLAMVVALALVGVGVGALALLRRALSDSRVPT
jgi:hypothetical protein